MFKKSLKSFCLGQHKPDISLYLPTVWFMLFESRSLMLFHSQGEYGGGNQTKTSGTLRLFNVTLQDDGVYTCVTHNSLLNISKRSKPARLTVQGEFLVYISIFFNSSLCELHTFQNTQNAFRYRTYIHFIFTLFYYF